MDHKIAVDLAEVHTKKDGKDEYVTTLGWGDAVEVVAEDKDRVGVRLTSFKERSDGSLAPVVTEGFIKKRAKSGSPKPGRVVVPAAESEVLRIDFVDVQQGDGTVLETPRGDVVLIDGGDNQLFARYLAGRFRGTTKAAPKDIAAILVSHGDADHFEGLTEIRRSEDHERPTKRLFIRPQRVFHNGLVKRPSKPALPENRQLGGTSTHDGREFVTELEDDLRDVDQKKMNQPFREWKAALVHWTERNPELEVVRLERDLDAPLDFLEQQGITVEVLGPRTVDVGGKPGLAVLREPRRVFGHPSGKPPETRFGGPSASHTINGHSILLRLTYGSWRILFAGDLNEEAEQELADADKAGELKLQSEVMKVPHHGSADFLFDFLSAVAPVVSVISSGDESPRKEYIHPRATLMAGLGRFSRTNEPVIFVTELVAFFRTEGWVRNVPPKTKKNGAGWSPRRNPFFAFSREAFGLVSVRMDRERMLVYTNSGKERMKEAYAYTLRDDGVATPEAIIRV